MNRSNKRLAKHVWVNEMEKTKLAKKMVKKINHLVYSGQAHHDRSKPEKYIPVNSSEYFYC